MHFTNILFYFIENSGQNLQNHNSDENVWTVVWPSMCRDNLGMEYQPTKDGLIEHQLSGVRFSVKLNY